ncbi:MAG TPA: hypothetical protein PKO25_06220 [Spirochaetota bacterium]|jgi:hypothetical protein|nr:hypothetical protein [Spirochaetota bacterium]OPZ39745.1 MAG: hypothetical protein BWY96_00068 [Spirochaetes bacterium ADurb.BinA120]HNU91449.1 hypothetical protein [Spirochaetota bacterium]HPI13955.1 hypothetical protein [Spirochaetota bacterium]HPO45171.1 hypothetical protein [Spirochaetota bacterium]
MGFFKNAHKSFIKYGEMLVDKTEEYTRLAKLSLEIKRLEYTIEKNHTEIGEYVSGRIEEGAREISLEDEAVQARYRNIVDCRDTIASRRKEIEEIKQARFAGPSTGSGKTAE